MSYEGYERWLCASGHLHEFDCYMTPDQREWACPVIGCGLPVGWVECVDQTNDSGNPSRLKVDKEPVTETCRHCHHVKQIEPQTFIIPKRKSGRRV